MVFTLEFLLFMFWCGDPAGSLNIGLCSVAFHIRTSQWLTLSFLLNSIVTCFIPVDPGCSLEDLPKCF